jgi:signal peptidase I
MFERARWNQFLPRRKAWRWVSSVVLAALVGIVGGRTVIGSLGSVSVVDGVSMLPTYRPGARVYTAPVSTVLARGDIVLLDDGKPQYALKRIIGLPGETIQFWRGYVFINRRMLIEAYLPKYTFTFPDEKTEAVPLVLGADQYFVMGDNRPISEDSRTYGPVKLDQIKSRVPSEAGSSGAKFAAFTLPNQGKRTIQRLN